MTVAFGKTALSSKPMHLSRQLIRKRAEQTCADGALSFKMMALMTIAFGALAFSLEASQPAWWTSRGAVNTNTKNDNLAINESQLKQFTQKAVLELNADLTNNGGAGPTLNAMVTAWSNDYQTNGYSHTNPKPTDLHAVNVGQLKYIARLVYGQLSAAGYTGLQPAWIVQNTNTDNYVANIGQLKTVFDWDLSAAPAPVTNLTATASTTSYSKLT